MFIDALAVSSPDIVNLERIADKFTSVGGHTIPRIHFTGVPEGAVELAVICHDPDAPLPNGFTHWVVYGIPADAAELELDTPAVRVGPNGVGATIWYGPEPPMGHGTHHYYFWLYALSRSVEGSPTREEFIAQYGDAVIEQARLVGTYSR